MNPLTLVLDLIKTDADLIIKNNKGLEQDLYACFKNYKTGSIMKGMPALLNINKMYNSEIFKWLHKWHDGEILKLAQSSRTKKQLLLDSLFLCISIRLAEKCFEVKTSLVYDLITKTLNILTERVECELDDDVSKSNCAFVASLCGEFFQVVANTTVEDVRNICAQRFTQIAKGSQLSNSSPSMVSMSSTASLSSNLSPNSQSIGSISVLTSSQKLLSLLTSFMYFKPKCSSVEYIKHYFLFLNSIKMATEEIKDKTVKKAVHQLYSKVLRNFSMEARHELNVPEVKSFIEGVFPQVIEAAKKNKSSMTFFSPAVHILCCSQKNLFLEHWKWMINVILTQIKSKNAESNAEYVDYLYNLFFVYIRRFGGDNDAQSESYLKTACDSLFKNAKTYLIICCFKTLHHILYIISKGNIDLAISLIFDLTDISAKILSPERIMLGISAFVYVMDCGTNGSINIFVSSQSDVNLAQSLDNMNVTNTTEIQSYGDVKFFSSSGPPENDSLLGISPHLTKNHIETMLKKILKLISILFSEIGEPFLQISIVNNNSLVSSKELFKILNESPEKKSKITLFLSCLKQIANFQINKSDVLQIVAICASLITHIVPGVREGALYTCQTLLSSYSHLREEIIKQFFERHLKDVNEIIEEKLDGLTSRQIISFFNYFCQTCRTISAKPSTMFVSQPSIMSVLSSSRIYKSLDPEEEYRIISLFQSYALLQLSNCNKKCVENGVTLLLSIRDFANQQNNDRNNQSHISNFSILPTPNSTVFKYFSAIEILERALSHTEYCHKYLSFTSMMSSPESSKILPIVLRDSQLHTNCPQTAYNLRNTLIQRFSLHMAHLQSLYSLLDPLTNKVRVPLKVNKKTSFFNPSSFKFILQFLSAIEPERVIKLGSGKYGIKSKASFSDASSYSDPGSTTSSQTWHSDVVSILLYNDSTLFDNVYEGLVSANTCSIELILEDSLTTIVSYFSKYLNLKKVKVKKVLWMNFVKIFALMAKNGMLEASIHENNISEFETLMKYCCTIIGTILDDPLFEDPQVDIFLADIISAIFLGFYHVNHYFENIEYNLQCFKYFFAKFEERNAELENPSESVQSYVQCCLYSLLKHGELPVISTEEIIEFVENLIKTSPNLYDVSFRFMRLWIKIKHEVTSNNKILSMILRNHYESPEECSNNFTYLLLDMISIYEQSLAVNFTLSMDSFISIVSVLLSLAGSDSVILCERVRSALMILILKFLPYPSARSVNIPSVHSVGIKIYHQVVCHSICEKYPEIVLPVVSNMFSWFQLANSSKKKLILKSFQILFLLFCFGDGTLFDVSENHNDSENFNKSHTHSSASSPKLLCVPQQVKMMLLHNLFWITTKYSTEHMEAIGYCWMKLCERRVTSHLNLIILYLTYLSQFNEPYVIAVARGIVDQLAQVYESTVQKCFLNLIKCQTGLHPLNHNPYITDFAPYLVLLPNTPSSQDFEAYLDKCQKISFDIQLAEEQHNFLISSQDNSLFLWECSCFFYPINTLFSVKLVKPPIHRFYVALNFLNKLLLGSKSWQSHDLLSILLHSSFIGLDNAAVLVDCKSVVINILCKQGFLILPKISSQRHSLSYTTPSVPADERDDSTDKDFDDCDHKLSELLDLLVSGLEIQHTSLLGSRSRSRTESLENHTCKNNINQKLDLSIFFKSHFTCGPKFSFSMVKDSTLSSNIFGSEPRSFFIHSDSFSHQNNSSDSTENKSVLERESGSDKYCIESLMDCIITIIRMLMFSNTDQNANLTNDIEIHPNLQLLWLHETVTPDCQCVMTLNYRSFWTQICKIPCVEVKENISLLLKDIEPLQSTRVMGRFLDHILFFLSHTSSDIYNFRNSWALEALDWALSQLSQHILCRSLQLFRLLQIPFDLSQFERVSSRVVDSIEDSDLNVRVYAFELIETVRHNLIWTVSHYVSQKIANSNKSTEPEKSSIDPAESSIFILQRSMSLASILLDSHLDFQFAISLSILSFLFTIPSESIIKEVLDGSSLHDNLFYGIMPHALRGFLLESTRKDTALFFVYLLPFSSHSFFSSLSSSDRGLALMALVTYLAIHFETSDSCCVQIVNELEALSQKETVDASSDESNHLSIIARSYKSKNDKSVRQSWITMVCQMLINSNDSLQLSLAFLLRLISYSESSIKPSVLELIYGCLLYSKDLRITSSLFKNLHTLLPQLLLDELLSSQTVAIMNLLKDRSDNMEYLASEGLNAQSPVSLDSQDNENIHHELCSISSNNPVEILMKILTWTSNITPSMKTKLSIRLSSVLQKDGRMTLDSGNSISAMLFDMQAIDLNNLQVSTNSLLNNPIKTDSTERVDSKSIDLLPMEMRIFDTYNSSNCSSDCSSTTLSSTSLSASLKRCNDKDSLSQTTISSTFSDSCKVSNKTGKLSTDSNWQFFEEFDFLYNHDDEGDYQLEGITEDPHGPSSSPNQEPMSIVDSSPLPSSNTPQPCIDNISSNQSPIKESEDSEFQNIYDEFNNIFSACNFNDSEDEETTSNSKTPSSRSNSTLNLQIESSKSIGFTNILMSLNKLILSLSNSSDSLLNNLKRQWNQHINYIEPSLRIHLAYLSEVFDSVNNCESSVNVMHETTDQRTPRCQSVSDSTNFPSVNASKKSSKASSSMNRSFMSSEFRSFDSHNLHSIIFLWKTHFFKFMNIHRWHKDNHNIFCPSLNETQHLLYATSDIMTSLAIWIDNSLKSQCNAANSIIENVPKFDSDSSQSQNESTIHMEPEGVTLAQISQGFSTLIQDFSSLLEQTNKIKSVSKSNDSDSVGFVSFPILILPFASMKELDEETRVQFVSFFHNFWEFMSIMSTVSTSHDSNSSFASSQSSWKSPYVSTSSSSTLEVGDATSNFLPSLQLARICTIYIIMTNYIKQFYVNLKIRSLQGHDKAKPENKSDLNSNSLKRRKCSGKLFRAFTDLEVVGTSPKKHPNGNKMSLWSRSDSDHCLLYHSSKALPLSTSRNNRGFKSSKSMDILISNSDSSTSDKSIYSQFLSRFRLSRRTKKSSIDSSDTSPTSVYHHSETDADILSSSSRSNPSSNVKRSSKLEFSRPDPPDVFSHSPSLFAQLDNFDDKVNEYITIFSDLIKDSAKGEIAPSIDEITLGFSPCSSSYWKNRIRASAFLMTQSEIINYDPGISNKQPQLDENENILEPILLGHWPDSHHLESLTERISCFIHNHEYFSNNS